MFSENLTNFGCENAVSRFISFLLDKKNVQSCNLQKVPSAINFALE